MRFSTLGGVALALLLVCTTDASAQLGGRLQINGYSSFEFESLFGEEGRGDPNNSFDADLFDLVFNFRATDRLRVAADLTWEHGAASEDNIGNVAVEYAFAEYRVSDWFGLRAGKDFMRFGIYNELHTAKPATMTVKEPQSTNKNNKFGSDIRFYPRWINGIAATGRGAIGDSDVDYVVQLSNGDGPDPYNKDDNTFKALSGRVRLSPSNDLTLGLSFYNDRISELDDDDEPTGGESDIFSYGAQAQWTPGDVGVEVEYVGGAVNESSGAERTRHAATFMVYRTWSDRWTPYARLEVLDPNTSIDDDYARRWIYGVNIRVDNGLYLKWEINTVQAGMNNSRFATDFSEIKAAVAVGF